MRLVRKTGGEDIEFYDVQTGLKAGSDHHPRNARWARSPARPSRAEYRKFGNLLQPTTVDEPGRRPCEQVITITAIEYDNVPASVFELPAGIKALLK